MLSRQSQLHQIIGLRSSSRQSRGAESHQTSLDEFLGPGSGFVELVALGKHHDGNPLPRSPLQCSKTHGQSPSAHTDCVGTEGIQPAHHGLPDPGTGSDTGRKERVPPIARVGGELQDPELIPPREFEQMRFVAGGRRKSLPPRVVVRDHVDDNSGDTAHDS